MSLIRPVILAGGPGARLWPLSGAARPKPFLSLDGERSLLDVTLLRLQEPELFAPPVIACAAALEGPAREALTQAGLAHGELILEPELRDTAAAIAAIACARAAANPDELLLIAPSDHVIDDAAAFRAACASASERASEGRLVLFGATPETPSEAFGYIQAAGQAALAEVIAFREKPAHTTAEAYLADGAHLWNMGLFLAPAATFLALFEAHAPAILDAARNAVAAGGSKDGALTLDADAYARAPRAAFDRAVVEKTTDALVARLDCGWRDVGAWDAVLAALPTNADGNALVGDVQALGARDTLVHADGVRVGAIGVEGLVIVATKDAVLVCRREDAQRVRELAEKANDQRTGK